MFIEYLDDILASFLSSGYMSFWYFPLIALAFIATVPALIRSLLEWR